MMAIIANPRRASTTSIRVDLTKERGEVIHWIWLARYEYNEIHAK
jgi:hypothetical protein